MPTKLESVGYLGKGFNPAYGLKLCESPVFSEVALNWVYQLSQSYSIQIIRHRSQRR